MKVFLHKSVFIVLLSQIIVFSSCAPFSKESPISTTSMKLNTIVTITIYDSTDESLLDGCLAICDQYEQLFSKTNPDSELYKLNHGLLSMDSLGYATVSPETYQLIALGKKYANESNDAFNIALEPLTSLWNFTDNSDVVPADSSIKQVLPYLSSDMVQLKEPNLVMLCDPKCGIDLGGIAKGYIADRIKDYLVKNGVQSALINLGGNVLCIGQMKDRPFSIGIKRPFSTADDSMTTISVTDCSVVSSGVYERYFEKDGILYHHLLNSKTGYPIQNGLLGVTIVAPLSVDADALSTTCFALGLEQGMKYIKTQKNTRAIFITDDYVLHDSQDTP